MKLLIMLYGKNTMMIFLIIKKLMALLMNLFTNQQITQIASQLFMISITSKKLNLLQVQKSLRALYLEVALKVFTTSGIQDNLTNKVFLKSPLLYQLS